jgi:hypothetical protein
MTSSKGYSWSPSEVIAACVSPAFHVVVAMMICKQRSRTIMSPSIDVIAAPIQIRCLRQAIANTGANSRTAPPDQSFAKTRVVELKEPTAGFPAAGFEILRRYEYAGDLPDVSKLFYPGW